MQKETVGEQELNLKKRARRRLVGAIALVLLMIIVLPMILKDRAATSPQDKVSISLPEDQQTITPTAPSDFDSNVVPAEPATQALPTTETATEPTRKSSAESQPESNEPVVRKTDPVASASKPEKLAPPKEVQPKDAAKPTVETPHHFYVQVGVFSDEGNVKQLQGKLSDLGYKSQTEKIDTAKGKKIRLRTQLFKDRNEAAIALENIKDVGLTGMVVSQ